MAGFRQRLRAGWLPFMALHIVAYPLAFLWAIAAMPVLFAIVPQHILLSDAQAQLKIGSVVQTYPEPVVYVLKRVLLTSAVPLALENAVALWLAMDPTKRKRSSAIATGVLFGTGALVAIVGWTHLLLFKK